MRYKPENDGVSTDKWEESPFFAPQSFLSNSRWYILLTQLRPGKGPSHRSALSTVDGLRHQHSHDISACPPTEDVLRSVDGD